MSEIYTVHQIKPPLGFESEQEPWLKAGFSVEELSYHRDESGVGEVYPRSVECWRCRLKMLRKEEIARQVKRDAEFWDEGNAIGLA